MNRTNIALLVIFALSLGASFACAETIPPDNWVYDALRTFELRGLVSLEPSIPYTRQDIERYVDAVCADVENAGISLGVRERFLLERLKEEFIGTKFEPEKREDRPVITCHEGDRFAAIDFTLGGVFLKSVDQKKGEGDGLFVPGILLGLGKRVTAEASYRVKMAPERVLNARYYKPGPRVTSFRGFTAEYERAVISAGGDWWNVRLGRDYAQWGSGREEGLLVSQTAGSLDQFFTEMSMWRFRLSAFQAILDPRWQRRLAAHRLSISLPRGIFLGLAETALYTRRNLDFAYLLPLGSYYGNQFNEAEDDNITWAVDWKAPVMRGLIVYGEFLIDDFQYQRDDKVGPDRLGLNLSAEALLLPAGRELEISAGYTRINMYTYAHKYYLRTDYVAGNGDYRKNPGLGSPLGPDADRWNLKASFSFHPRAVLAIDGSLIRRGEGNNYREWFPGMEWNPPFPSGKVLKERTISANQFIDLRRGSSLSAGGGVRFLSGGPRNLDEKEGFGWLELILDL